MIFSSVFFLSVFLPITLAGYYIAPRGYRNGILFLMSLLFYAWGEPVYISIMLFSTVLDYGCGQGMARNSNSPNLKKFFLMLSVMGNLGLLAFFKYGDFVAINANQWLGLAMPIRNLALPIGISFYTFQTMSYSIDVYLGNCPAQKNFISFGCYVTMFPQLIAGPIVRYVDVVNEINTRTETLSQFALGVNIFCIGLGKKVLLANSIGMMWDAILAQFLATHQLSILSAWLGVLAFAFQLYFDFSGYSDMAIGMGHMFGFKFPKNFNYPYLSTSVSEFWRRWHMTLGTWFKEYVYIPLGGNRGSKLQWIRNVAIVWFLTGLWHGANWNYILWGLYFGVVLAIEKLTKQQLDKLPKLVGWMMTMVLVAIAWVLFAIESLPDSLLYIQMMFRFGGTWVDAFGLYQVSNYGILLVVLVIASTPWWKRLPKVNSRWLYVYCLVLLVCSYAYLVDASYNPFLYFRF